MTYKSVLSKNSVFDWIHWVFFAALTAVYSFLVHAKEDFQKLSRMHESMEKLYQNVMGYYAIDLKKVSVEEFLTDLNNFRMMFMVQFYA